MRIPLSSPDISEEDISAVAAVLRTTQLSLGPQLEMFEVTLAEYLGAAEAIAVSSGTSALHLCLRALGIGEGDEVIVPSFAFIAVANAVRYEKAVPVFVDIERATLNLAAEKIAAAITTKTKAIVVVHTFGCPAAMEKILEIAQRHGLRVIEDACEALGSDYRGKKVGTIGDAGVFGFYPNKQITTGEGGAIVTQNAKLATQVRSLRNQGRVPKGDWLQHEELGYNYRISEMNCALGLSQLKRLPEILRQRASIATKYRERLQKEVRLTLPLAEVEFGKVSWFVYVVRLAEDFQASQRDWILQEMAKKGIACGRYFAPIHWQPAYQHIPHRCMDLLNTESIAGRTLALPFFNRITDEQIAEVCETLGGLFDKCK